MGNRMMNVNALFKLTYGLYIASVEWNGKLCGCIINTAAQATVEPNRVLLTMLKTNYTTELISKKGSLSISILSLETSLDIIKNFGYQSGRNCDKFHDIKVKFDSNMNPYMEETMVAYLGLEIQNTIDLDTHLLFVCTVTEAEIVNNLEPMSYEDYRNLKSNGVMNKPGSLAKDLNKITYTCSVCHYVYDGDIPFENLSDEYVCPVCKKPKSFFVASSAN